MAPPHDETHRLPETHHSWGLPPAAGGGGLSDAIERSRAGDAAWLHFASRTDAIARSTGNVRDGSAPLKVDVPGSERPGRTSGFGARLARGADQDERAVAYVAEKSEEFAKQAADPQPPCRGRYWAKLSTKARSTPNRLRPRANTRPDRQLAAAHPVRRLPELGSAAGDGLGHDREPAAPLVRPSIRGARICAPGPCRGDAVRQGYQ
jgi:hypothetical protein